MLIFLKEGMNSKWSGDFSRVPPVELKLGITSTNGLVFSLVSIWLLVGWFVSIITQKQLNWSTQNVDVGWVSAQNALLAFGVDLDKGTDQRMFL